MTESWHDRRTAELRALQQSDPRSIIDLYCEITGRFNGGQMPHQASFSRMIAAIVDHEVNARAAAEDKSARMTT
jgi:hypothetical protein